MRTLRSKKSTKDAQISALQHRFSALEEMVAGLVEAREAKSGVTLEQYRGRSPDGLEPWAPPVDRYPRGAEAAMNYGPDLKSLGNSHRRMPADREVKGLCFNLASQRRRGRPPSA